MYEEILHEILHCIGSEKNGLNQENIIAFAREAFKIEQDTHDAIYRAVVEKEVSTYTYSTCYLYLLNITRITIYYEIRECIGIKYIISF